MDLAQRQTTLVGELSLGDQRTTEIIMSLALRPPTVLLTSRPREWAAGKPDITELIHNLHKDQALAMVLIEHDMRVVFQLAQRIMVLAEGRVLAEGTPVEIAANGEVQAAYLGKAV